MLGTRVRRKNLKMCLERFDICESPVCFVWILCSSNGRAWYGTYVYKMAVPFTTQRN